MNYKQVAKYTHPRSRIGKIKLGGPRWITALFFNDDRDGVLHLRFQLRYKARS